MRLSQSASASPSIRGKRNRLGPSGRKKHKRLDLICENEYNRNRGNENENSRGTNAADSASPAEHDSELRRSTRVRRVPVILDLSPPPPKKRKKIGGTRGRTRRALDMGTEKGDSSKRDVSATCSSGESDDDLCSWKSRLRSRVSTSSHQGEGEGVLPCQKSTAVKDYVDVEQEAADMPEDDLKEEGSVDGRNSGIIKSKRPGRSKASVDCEADLHDESEDDQPKLRSDMAISNFDLNERCCDEVDNDRNNVGVNTLVNTVDVVEGSPVNGMNHGAITEVSGDRAVSLQVEQETKVGFGSQSEKGQICNDVEVAGEINKIMKSTEHVVDASEQNHIHLSESGPKQVDNSSTVNSLEQGDSMQLQDLSRQTDSVEVVNPVTASLVDNNFNINGESDGPDVPQEKPLECVADPEKVKSGKKRLKEGRRCGLCGGGTDGKPPKKLVQDTVGNYHEADIGSSGSEDPNYDVWDGFSEEPGWLGKLLGPINDRYGIAGIWVHQQCAVWSPEVYFAGIGCLKNIRAALLRGRALKCTRCGRPGATTGCRVDRCPRTYHLPCARASRCEFDHRKFLIACTDHRHLFQPQGYNYIQRRKKLKAKKLKLEIRKLSNDASRRDLEAEEKWLEKCGEDEEFLKRESKRLQRDMARMAPVYIGGSHPEAEKLFEGWESVGGLQDVIRCLKEVVILPLLYPEFFSNLGLTPPRGVLLHGHPGTGKTLVVRSLIGSCARGDKRIAYFARKGADCLGKYVGDAERQLRLLFQVAEKSQPSIIFFDEIDGLAPVRSRQQDQTHSSVVSTLLALMDGLKNRGSVIVIGATNRPDAVDPALRRPGRFDREIYFPLPSMSDRAAILALHTRSWPKPLNGSLLDWIAKRTTNFAGADLQALCTHAAITALKRICPLHKILSDAARRNYGKRPQLPPVVVNESDWLEALSSSPPPCSRREAGMAANEVSGYPLCSDLILGLLKPLSTLLVTLHLDDHIWLPPAAYNAAKSIKNAIVSALEQKLWQTDKWWSHVHDLVLESDIACRIIRDLSSIGILVADTFSVGHNVSHDTCDENESSFGSWSSLSSEPAKLSMFGKRDAYRILIAGNPRSGQKHLASCLLLCFVGNIEIQKIDMATISQEGHGDMVQGMTKILLRCASVKSCVVFLPRIDLWALEDFAPLMASQTSDEDNFDSGDGQTGGISDGNYLDTCSLAEESEPQGEEKCASEAWKSFIEQFGSIGVSTSLVVLATSEAPYPELPSEVRQFFEGGFLLSKGFVFSEHKVPRITVELDGKFNREQMAQSSASKLSWDMIKQFIHLIHHRVHPSQEPGMSFLSQFKGQKHMPNHDMDHGYKQEATSAAQCPQDSVRAAAPSDNKIVKEKSNILMAIHSFGYQILTCPHFAELCWVTSKLKDGPCTDVCGPWKGWPFNSCIIRPANASDQDVVASTISNDKGKTQFTSVTGLVAVGLSAYRGVYTSLSQVSMDIREVLNVIVGEVNLRIQSGKERGQFFRLLSQVAYFEDMVNNWVYSLRSLESDAQTTVAGPHPNLYNHAVSADKYEGCRDRWTQIKGEASLPNQNILNFAPAVQRTLGNANIGAGRLHKEIENPEIEVLNIKEHSLKEVHMPGHGQSCNVKITTEPVNCEKEYPLMVSRHSHISSDDNLNDRSTNPEKESSSKVALDVLDLPKEKSPRLDKIEGDPSRFNISHSRTNISLELSSNEERGTASEVCRSENREDPLTVGREIDTARQVNGSTPLGSIISDDMNGLDLSGSYSNSILPDNLPLAENGSCNDEAQPHCAEDVELSCKTSTSPCEEYQLVCSYNCCVHCIDALHSLIQKVVVMEWERSGGSLTVEDAHDLVESLSTSLCLAVRKLDVENPCGSHETKESSWRLNSVVNSAGIDACKCMMLEIYTSPRVCTCHSGNLTKASSYVSHHTGVGSSFIYKGCVLLPADSGKDVPLHCIHENLCLCPLIELIAITKCR